MDIGLYAYATLCECMIFFFRPMVPEIKYSSSSSHLVNVNLSFLSLLFHISGSCFLPFSVLFSLLPSLLPIPCTVFVILHFRTVPHRAVVSLATVTAATNSSTNLIIPGRLPFTSPLRQGMLGSYTNWLRSKVATWRSKTRTEGEIQCLMVTVERCLMVTVERCLMVNLH